MTYAEYAALPGIRASDIKAVLRSPAHYWHEKNHPVETEAMAFGRAFHAWVLDPEEFAQDYIVATEMDRRTKEGKELFGRIMATGKQIVSAGDMETIRAMDRSLRSHPDASRMLAECETEQVRQWDGMKARADMVGRGWIADLKTTTDASPSGARSAMLRGGYHVQAAHYAEGFNCFRFWLIMVEKTAPFAVGVYEIGEDAMDEGEELRQKGIAALKLGEKTGVWPGYPTGVLGLTRGDE